MSSRLFVPSTLSFFSTVVVLFSFKADITWKMCNTCCWVHGTIRRLCCFWPASITLPFFSYNTHTNKHTKKEANRVVLQMFALSQSLILWDENFAILICWWQPIHVFCVCVWGALSRISIDFIERKYSTFEIPSLNSELDIV